MITLLFAGDLVPPQTMEKIYSTELLKELEENDFSIVNLECPLTEHNEAIVKTGSNFKSHPETIRHIKKGAFDAVCLSNNHILDYGHQGVMDTIDICNQNGIQTVGAGANLKDAQKPLHITLKGKRICILNYSEKEFNIATHSSGGANPYSDIAAYYDIEREKKENDFVIVVYHGGLEYQHYPTLTMVDKFKFMVDVGADAVISHHTHRYSGYMQHKGKPIFFGLGNFISETSTKPVSGWLNGIIIKLRLSDSEIGFDIVPTSMNSSFNFVDLAKESQTVLDHIEQLSEEITDTEFLEQYWATQYEREAYRILSLLKSQSRNHYRVLKNFPFLSSKSLGAYKSKMFLNMLRCDSHRERLIAILEKNG